MKESKILVGLGVASASQMCADIIHFDTPFTLTHTGFITNDVDQTSAGLDVRSSGGSFVGDADAFNQDFALSIGFLEDSGNIQLRSGFAPNVSADKASETAMVSGSEAYFFSPGESINNYSGFIDNANLNDTDLDTLNEGVEAYIGFRFENPANGSAFGGNGTGQHGWAKIQWTDKSFSPTTGGSDFSVSLEVTEMAFTTEGEDIVAGQTVIPEPNALVLGLLAAGAAGLGVYKRNQKKTS